MNVHIIQKFTDSEKFSSIEGGQNESIKAGDVVLKPVHEIKRYLWISDELNKLQFDQIKVALPLKSKKGNYIEDAFGATPYFEGKFYKNKLTKKLEACRILNSKISSVQKPQDFDNWINPWTKAQDLAWNKPTVPQNIPLEIAKAINELLNLRKPLTLLSQLIHTDLAGNILFDEADTPIVIDFTPGFYPKEYGELLLLVDSIAWYNASLDILQLINATDFIKQQLVIRALIFRLSVSCFCNENNIKADLFFKDYEAYIKVIEWIRNGNAS